MNPRRMWDAIERTTMEDSKPRTFHNIECARLRGGECDCKMATTLIVPTHYTPIDGIHYIYPRKEDSLTYIIDNGFVKVLDGDDMVDEFPNQMMDWNWRDAVQPRGWKPND